MMSDDQRTVSDIALLNSNGSHNLAPGSQERLRSRLGSGRIRLNLTPGNLWKIAVKQKPKVIVTSCRREAATICPRLAVTLTFDLLTLKVVSESRVTWATSVPI